MENPSWFYDEMVQVGTDYENEAEVANYDSRMGQFRDFAAESGEIAGALDLGPGKTLVEFGCGTAEHALALAPRCARVFAADVSRVMIDYASRKARDRGCGNITFVHSGFLNYEHGGEPADAVLSQLALHHLPDFWKQVALAKMAGIMKDGGRLYLKDVVFSLDLDRLEKTVEYQIAQMERDAGPDTHAKFVRHIRQEYSTYDWILEEMIYRAGFELERADYGDKFLAVYVAVKTPRKTRR